MATSKVFTGIFWSSIQRFGTMIISFVTNIVLARLLTPDDFGTIGMLLLFLAIANTFVDSGFGSALIQKKDADQTDFSTVFFINLGLSIVVYAILFLGAPWIAQFYNVEILKPLLRVQGLILFMNAFCIIQTSVLRKNMDFKKLSVCNLVGNVVGSVIGIGAAVIGYGVWSLVIRTLVVGLITSLMLWIIGRWKPMFVFSKKSFRELFGFGGFMLLSSIVTTIGNNIQTLIIGKFFKPNLLGHYTQAKQLRDVSSMSISTVVSQVIYPDFSKIQNDKEQLKRHLLLSMSILSFVVAPMMGMFILVAEPLIVLLYSERWMPAVPYFEVLCIGGVFLSLQDVNYNLVAAVGKSKVLFYANVLQVIVSILLMILGSKVWGMMGLLWAMVVSSFLFYCIYATMAAKQSDTTIWAQFVFLFKNSILSFLSFGGSYFVINMINYSSFLIVLIGSVCFLMIYLILSFLTKSEALKYLISMVKK